MIIGIGIALGAAAGCLTRSLWGRDALPGSGVGIWVYAGLYTAAWWTATYPLGDPELGTAFVAMGFAYLLGCGLAALVQAIRRGFGDDGDDGGGGGGGGGGGWDDDGPAPWDGPGPDGRKPEAAPVFLTMADFHRETASSPAPAEPAPLIPTGR